MKKLFSILLAAAMLLSLASCSGKTDEGGDTTAADDTADYSASDVALSGEHFSFTLGEVSYVFFDNYRDFVNNNYDNLTVYGLDTTSSIKNQTYYGDTTWFSYFADASVGYCNDILLMCEKAYDEGVELDDADKENIDATVQSYIDYATDNGYETSEFLSTMYNDDVTLDVIRSYLEKETLGLKYYNELTGSYEFTDGELQQFAEENSDVFNTVSYLSYTFDEDSDANASASAAALAKITDAAGFESYTDKYMADTLSMSEDEISAADISYSYVKKSSDDFSTWAFGDAAVGETYTYSNEVDGEYTVYLLTKAPSLQDYTARTIRYIYVTVATNNTYQAALEKANELLGQWKAGEATEHSFGELAYNYSEDRDTCYQGGLWENVTLSSGTTPFPQAMLDWLYSADTAVGDTSVFKGDGGYYIAFYSAEGITEWKYEAKNGLDSKQYDSDRAAMEEQYEITKDEAVINAINA